MRDIYILKHLEQVRAIADPLRIRILNLLCQQALTTKQVAEHLGESVNKLYHHVEILESAELITLVETKKNRGTLEKYFRAVAKHFTLSPVLFEVRLDAGEGEAVSSELTFSSALQATLGELKESLDEKPVDANSRFFQRLHIQTTEEKATALKNEFLAWLEHCRAAQTEEGDVTYGITATLYPIKQKKS